MPKYLFKVSYTASGLEGALKEGGSSRMDAARDVIESVGGSLETFYFAFGDVDAYLVADFPDHASAASVAMRTSASGALRINTVPLITPQEVDEAAQKSVEYRPPGT